MPRLLAADNAPMTSSSTAPTDRAIRLAHLYPNLMNLYGDRGNIITLRQRCAAYDIDLRVTDLGLGDPFDPEAYDLVFIGGGQDREQRRIAEDLLTVKGAAIRSAAEAGTPMLAVCGGYQLFGRSYQPAAGEELPGLGIFPMRTVHPGEAVPRCIGNVEAVLTAECGARRPRMGMQDSALRTLVGFENHGGRTYLEDGATPLARVVAGYGNNGDDGTEGAVTGNVYGTYLHGSLLPKNPHVADHLILLALRRRYGADVTLPSLDDSLEQRAHADAARIARADAAAKRRGRLRTIVELTTRARRLATRRGL
jgi:CobQ-like glutamine amidotransferase family enzyme